MFCKQCGNQLNEGAAFCPCCGEKVVLTQQAQTSVASPTQSAVQSVGGSQNKEFWRFIWCDGLLLLAYILCIPVFVLPGAFVINGISLLLLLITVFLWLSKNSKMALIFLVMTMASSIIILLVYLMGGVL